MPHLLQRVPRSELVFPAFIVSGIDGLLSLAGTFIFTDHEPLLLWIAVWLPAFGWIPVLASMRYPRSALAVYFAIAVTTVLLIFRPWEVSPYGSDANIVFWRTAPKIIVLVLLMLRAARAEAFRRNTAVGLDTVTSTGRFQHERE